MRRTWMRRKAPRRLSRAGSDPAYLEKVRRRPCWFTGASDTRCEGPVHAHHAIHRSQGGKDVDAVPLCAKHHRAWHEDRPPFRGLDRLQRFAWATRAIADTRAAIAATGPRA